MLRVIQISWFQNRNCMKSAPLTILGGCVSVRLSASATTF